MEIRRRQVGHADELDAGAVPQAHEGAAAGHRLVAENLLCAETDGWHGADVVAHRRIEALHDVIAARTSVELERDVTVAGVDHLRSARSADECVLAEPALHHGPARPAMHAVVTGRRAEIAENGLAGAGMHCGAPIGLHDVVAGAGPDRVGATRPNQHVTPAGMNLVAARAGEDRPRSAASPDRVVAGIADEEFAWRELVCRVPDDFGVRRSREHDPHRKGAEMYGSIRVLG